MSSQSEAYKRYNRSAKGKARNEKYKRTEKCRANQRRYNKTEKGRATQKRKWSKPETLEQHRWRQRSLRKQQRIDSNAI